MPLLRHVVLLGGLVIAVLTSVGAAAPAAVDRYVDIAVGPSLTAARQAPNGGTGVLRAELVEATVGEAKVPGGAKSSSAAASCLFKTRRRPRSRDDPRVGLLQGGRSELREAISARLR